ncbi:Helix-turn-helix domain-containing protein [Natronorubrum sediminis]|uniref:Helix-turn-helix domain-containing protein n=1 Tax=Natronorubrum sediminis TaxID=640943 RepID=A0A1H6FPD4_9EURY|nr:helix-turn-helix domain-containing protein [Natronorubrum sediminis]SEH12779.1 Helix-turn-helix domain-containing protein [Natronorubrum sediminis]
MTAPTITTTERDESALEDEIDAETVLEVLSDDACRAILEATGRESLTATELSEHCEIPASTAYRKVEQLTDAGLLESYVRINTSGKHATEYRTCFDDVQVSVGGGTIDIEVTGPTVHADSEPSFTVADD